MSDLSYFWCKSFNRFQSNSMEICIMKITTMNKIVSIAKGKCPCCNKGDVFSGKHSFLPIRFPEMREKCEVCGFKYEKEPGFFYGSMYVSYGLGVGEGIAIFVIGQLFFAEAFDVRILYAIIASQLLLRVVNYRLSRLLWMYMFAPKEKCDTLQPKEIALEK